MDISYPNSLFKLLATAVAAFPPPYFLVNSSLIRSRNAIGTCLPTDSTATTQYAVAWKHNYLVRKKEKIDKKP